LNCGSTNKKAWICWAEADDICQCDNDEN
jgi:hypothetical protein